MMHDNLKQYDYRQNLIADRDNPILIGKAWRDRFSGESHWRAGYGGQAYLSRPNSEDALTWNTFRSLQLAGKSGLEIISSVFGISRVARILFWGCDVEHFGEEQQMLSILIRIIDGKHGGIMTEPDLVLIAEQEVAFVECKLNQSGQSSPWQARGEGAAKRFETYKKEFPELRYIGDWRDVYQLIRQYVYSRSLGLHLKKRSLVVPLINEKHKDTLLRYYSKLRNNNLSAGKIFRDFVTWQDINSAILTSDLTNREIISTKIEAALKHAR
jgi:hypothetical protein